jgi:D-alanyl-D-alanine carboxypeptidase
MRKRRWLIGGIMMILWLAIPFQTFAREQVQPDLHASEVSVSAKAAALIDVQSGRILYGKNLDKRMRIASLTKIITAIVAIESGKLDETVTVSKNAYRVEGSSIYLDLGEKQKLIDLVYAIMLRSGNDAATAIAEHVGGGSVQKFVGMMNAKVKELGLEGTHFANPHGLDAEDHYSTAYDMVQLTAYALRNPIFREVVSTKVKKIPWEGKDWNRTMRNKNKMLIRYEGADGVKTGYTEEAGRCLASSATRYGRQLAVIVLQDGNDWNDSGKLLDYGFTKYQYFSPVTDHQPVTSLQLKNGTVDRMEVLAGEKLAYPLREEEKQQVRTELKLPKYLRAPLKEREKVGEMIVYLHETKIGSLPLVAKSSAEGIGLWQKVLKLLESMFRR